MNRKNDLQIDVGILTTLELWPNRNIEYSEKFLDEYQNSIKKHLKKACENVWIKNVQVEVNMTPKMHGYWKSCDAHTMQHQSCNLGIPSMQLELPMHVRQKFNVSEAFRSKFLQALVNIYNESVAKFWVKSKIRDNIFINEEYINADHTFCFTDQDY